MTVYICHVICGSRYEGLRGFYKGIFPYLLHVLPNICIVFLIYENVVSHWRLATPEPDPSCTEQLYRDKKAAVKRRTAATQADKTGVNTEVAYVDDTTDLYSASLVNIDTSAAVRTEDAATEHDDAAAEIERS